jgi:hypothetical protein
MAAEANPPPPKIFVVEFVDEINEGICYCY